MSTSHVESARPVRKKSLALGAIMLSIACLALPALAQKADSESALPDAPSARLSALPDAPSADSSAVAPAVTTTTTTDHPFTLGERAHAYARAVFSPVTIIGPAFAAGIEQAEDEPPSWGGGAEAFGKRYGSAAARRVMAETVIFGFAAADGEDPRYFPSQDRRAWARARHAIVSTFVSPTSHGVTIPAFSRFVGVYGAAFISNTWYPDNRATAGNAAVRGTWGMVGSLGLRLASEFVPLFRKYQQ
jgi:hypothetical protein